MKTLYYVHDPMCSWCWAFRPVLLQLQQQLPTNIQLKYLLGGLAPDSDQAMEESTQLMIQHHWHTIEEKVPHTQFNFDFWTSNTPKRSTYPACRAVIAAKAQDKSKEQVMIFAIQQAYYLNALNPSEEETLVHCAANIGLDSSLFKQDLNSEHCQALLESEINQCRKLSIYSFPSLVLEDQGNLQRINIDYNNVEPLLAQL